MTYALPHVTEVRMVALEDEIDREAILKLQRQIGDALDAGRCRIVLSLSAATGLGSESMSQFCRALRRLNGRQARLAIVGAPAHVRRVLELCELDGLELYPTLNAALLGSGAHPTVLTGASPDERALTVASLDARRRPHLTLSLIHI